MRQVRFVDTTIRDGQASLWAMNMRTRHMAPVMPLLDQAGFDQMEFLAPGSRLKKFVRHLRENPWDWIHTGARLARDTQLRWHGHISGSTMSGRVPIEVGTLLFAKAVELGIRYTRTGDNWNDFTRVAQDVKRLDDIGMTSVVNVMYSVSPRHTDEYFVTKAREAAALKPWRLCFKDVGGLLTPERTRELLPKMMAVTGDIEWEFHGHCNNGLGPLNAIEAVKAGVGYVHTAVPPLANGSSQPSIHNVPATLRALGHDPLVDEAPLREVTARLTEIAHREDLPVGVPHEYDERLYAHQVPGGMISNLRHQLERAGVGDRLEETLEETGRVRADFGYPIMVTPLSQFVGTQAAINVIVGERYRQVTDAAIEYALGWHGGAEATGAMDPDVRDRILDRPRAREIARTRRPDPTLKELRARYGRGISDEDLILRAIGGGDALDVLRDAPPDTAGDTPLIRLIRELAERPRPRLVTVAKPGMSLTIRKSGR